MFLHFHILGGSSHQPLVNATEKRIVLSYRLRSGMETTGIASQFAMQSMPICDVSSNMRRKHCDALLGYSTLLF